jgi:hypothetical protein
MNWDHGRLKCLSRSFGERTQLHYDIRADLRRLTAPRPSRCHLRRLGDRRIARIIEVWQAAWGAELEFPAKCRAPVAFIDSGPCPGAAAGRVERGPGIAAGRRIEGWSARIVVEKCRRIRRNGTNCPPNPLSSLSVSQQMEWILRESSLKASLASMGRESPRSSGTPNETGRWLFCGGQGRFCPLFGPKSRPLFAVLKWAK